MHIIGVDISLLKKDRILGARKRAAVISLRDAILAFFFGVEAMGRVAVDGLCSLLLHPIFGGAYSPTQ